MDRSQCYDSANVTIGRGTVVGAGSIVTKDIPPYSIYTGVPNVKCRNRFSQEKLQAHLAIVEKNFETKVFAEYE